MNRYLCIDGGTTNTRIALVCDNEIISKTLIPMGSKDNIGGNKEFKKQLKSGIERLLCENELSEAEITAIIASGMITSDYGLFEVKHLAAPVGISELHSGMIKAAIPEICDIPFYLIPGVIVKNGEFDTDMMRGEETEIFGLVSYYGTDNAYLLPGSHSKLITLDKAGKIDSVKTFLSGEMLSALAENTILKGTVNIKHSDFDPEYLIKGYELSAKNGINEALFKTRILKNVFAKSELECYSFYLGAVFAGEISAIKNCDKKGVVIGGKSALKDPLAHILKQKTDLKVITADDTLTSACTTLGAIKIFEFKK